MNTFKRDYLPVIVGVPAAFVVSTIWYSPLLFGKQWFTLRSQWMHIAPGPHIASWKPLAELARETIVAYVLSMRVWSKRKPSCLRKLEQDISPVRTDVLVRLHVP